MNLTLHPASQKLLAAYSTHMPHALLITGKSGIGVSTVAENLAKQISKNVTIVLPEKDEKIDLETGTITVGIIRRLYEQTRTKHSRVVVIDYAERMATQAQNAFLKLLEEPGSGTTFILACHDPQRLLPTILSRVQQLELREISREASLELVKALGVTDQTKQSQLLYIAEGLPAKLAHLATDEKFFEKEAQSVRDAKELLQASPYDKLLIAQRYRADRPGSLAMLDIALKMTRQSFTATSDSRATRQLETLLDTYDAISGNGNIRLQLARLAL